MFRNSIFSIGVRPHPQPFYGGEGSGTSPSIRFTLLFFVVLIVLSCNTSPQEKKEVIEEPIKTEDDPIRIAREFSNQGIERKDTAALASVWTSDYHVITSRNYELLGRTASRDWFFKEFSIRPDVIYIRTPVSVNVFEKWNMASETGTWVGRWTEKGVPIEVSGSYVAKWHKVNGTWLIRAEVFVPLKCSGGDYCDEAPVK